MAVMKDVAKLSGVSISTVSFVLNGTAKEHKVAESTAKKVYQAAKQLGYKINSSLKNMETVQKRQRNIAFYLPLNSLRFDMSAIYAAISQHISQTGRDYNVTLCPYEPGALAAKLSHKQLDFFDSAVVSVQSESDLKELESLSLDVPIVLYDRISEAYSGITCLADEAISQAVKMIVAKGYRDIRILTSQHNLEQGDEFFNRLQQNCEESGITLTEENFIRTEDSMIGGAIAARTILNQEKRPEMIICMNMPLTFGVIPVLARHNFFIPYHTELLCFGSSGDADHIRNYIPSLSMIARPLNEITIKAFDMALHLADGEESKAMHYHYSCELLLNDSFNY
ncbi:LacI family DNA-binding transcriptional regulator [Scatolibacter rhodanostii]|uniref:LacI family DNA-binding transcriptional regulator n=1 Tax=Scatolibacter rhodanostii TaxID=2014781 RepID=UPI000C07E227|nr:LacI family DNA-binding transcriptional regulator [Scatolibacter rhodanostii]